MLLSPAGEGVGHKFRVSLSHQFAWGFLVVLVNEDLMTGPGVFGGFTTTLAGILARRRACLACSRKNSFRELYDNVR